MTDMFRVEAASAPPPPRRALKEKLLDAMNLTQAELARAIGISGPRLNMILKGRCPISAEVALRIERVFDISPQYWLRLRDEFELFQERQRISDELDQLPQLRVTRREKQSVWRRKEWMAAV